jgi:hypothetical protein
VFPPDDQRVGRGGSGGDRGAAPRLKETFPLQRIVHRLDAGYGNGPMLQALEAVHHKFIGGFKPGSIPTLYPEALTLEALNPHNRIRQTSGPKRHRVRREYTWVNDLEYEGLTVHFVMCQETTDGQTTTFAGLTNFRVDRDNVIRIAQGGRQRRTLENEGFNEQKTGYELERFCDGNDLEVMTNLYLLLQIAHLFMQWLARSDLIDPVSTLTFLAHLLLEALRNSPLSDDLFDPQQPRFQIRFARAPT